MKHTKQPPTIPPPPTPEQMAQEIVDNACFYLVSQCVSLGLNGQETTKVLQNFVNEFTQAVAERIGQ